MYLTYNVPKDSFLFVMNLFVHVPDVPLHVIVIRFRSVLRFDRVKDHIFHVLL